MTSDPEKPAGVMKYMAQRLDTITNPIEYCLLQKGSRLFALLGKATPFGILGFRREDIGTHCAVTAEFGCIRLERLTGEEEVLGFRLFLPTSETYDYGIFGTGGSEDLTRMVFGLLPAEMEEFIRAVRRGSFPMLGYSTVDLKCSISSCVIPGRWPHFVVSNEPRYGNVVCLETFVRILISSLPNGRLDLRLPGLQSAAIEILKLMGSDRPGLPYNEQILDAMAAEALAVK